MLLPLSLPCHIHLIIACKKMKGKKKVIYDHNSNNTIKAGLFCSLFLSFLVEQNPKMID